MYFTLRNLDNNSDWSYLLCKKPGSVYDRKEGSAKITGQYSADGLSYTGWIERDSLEYLQIAKGQNLSNYVFPEKDAVSPMNLSVFYTMFRSILTHTGLPKNIEDTIGHYAFEIGPVYIINQEQEDSVTSLFSAYSLILNVDSEKSKEYAKTISICGNMTLCEFLQKSYVLLFYWTMYLTKNKHIITKEILDKYIRLSKDWLYQNEEYAQKVSRRLSFTKEKESYFLIGIEQNAVQKEKTQQYLDKKARNQLKQTRQDFIIAQIKQNYLDHKCIRIVELGCGKGELIWELKRQGFGNITGYDADEYAVRKSRSRHIRQMNILYPYDDQIQDADVLVLTEVLEHFNQSERQQLYQLMMIVYQPKVLIITTPNIEYNQFYPTLVVGTYRHKDHQIEFTSLEFQTELKALDSQYDVIIFDQIGNSDSDTVTDLKPTLVSVLKRKEAIRLYQNRHMGDFYHRIDLLFSQCYGSSQEILSGICHHSLIENYQNIFYLGATIAPVFYDAKCDLLEHPYSALEYYLTHGQVDLVAERKEMGSRCYILVFADPNKAAQLGYHKITMNSRQGFPFFDRNDPRLEELYVGLQAGLRARGKDIAMFDAECLPWRIKAELLIIRDFQAPAEAQLLQKEFTRQNTNNEQKFLSELTKYSRDEDWHIVLFGILLEANIKDTRGHLEYVNVLHGFYLNHVQKVFITDMYAMYSSCIKSVKQIHISTNSSEKRELAILEFYENCCDTGEGIVVKPLVPMTINKSGKLVLPALKVRGKEYLRLIYGIDMYDPEYFKLITNRYIAKKRQLSIIQHELGLMMLQAFLKQDRQLLLRYVALFQGMEQMKYSHLDKTL